MTARGEALSISHLISDKRKIAFRRLLGLAPGPGRTHVHIILKPHLSSEHQISHLIVCVWYSGRRCDRIIRSKIPLGETARWQGNCYKLDGVIADALYPASVRPNTVSGG